MSRKRLARIKRMLQAHQAGHDPRVVFPVPSGRDAIPHTQRKEVKNDVVKFHPPAPSRARACTLPLRREAPWLRDLGLIEKGTVK